MYYQSEYHHGKIISTFNTTTNDPAAADDYRKPEYRLYKITRGIKDTDYLQWPGYLGAPFHDLNNNGVWDNGIDEPALTGDQQLWTVSNDVDIQNHYPVGRTNPMGIELQSTFFLFAASGVAENTVFLRYKFINKSDADYDSVFISYWSDTDIGDATDDRAGVDTVRQMAYVYNGDNNDEGSFAYGTAPPANGFILLQGPMVFTGNDNDTAWFGGEKRTLRKNLPMSSHSVFFYGIWDDPWIGSADFASQAYNYQKGLKGKTGEPFIDPVTNLPSKFIFPGDPVTATGWTLDKSGRSSGDMRSMFSTGPFTLAKNDTQEIVIAFTIARGTDNLASITMLRKYADSILAAFQNNYTPFSFAGQAPLIYFNEDPTLLNFPKTFVGSTSDTISFNIANFGSDTLRFTTSTFSGGMFFNTYPDVDTVKIAGGSSLPLKFVFQPTTVGRLSDTIVLKTNDPMHPLLKFGLNGIGAKIDPVVPGLIYASDSENLYTITPSNGVATLVTRCEPETFVFNMAVHPGTRELYSLRQLTYGEITLFRISSTGPSTIPVKATLTGATISGGISFMNNDDLLFAGDKIIGKFNINNGSIDTVYHFLNGHRIKSMSYNRTTNEIYYAQIPIPGIKDTADAIFKLNLATKQITRIGRVKVGNRVRALMFDVNDKLYGIMDSAIINQTFFVTIDTSSGIGTKIGSTGVYYLQSLALDPSVPANVIQHKNTIPEVFSLEQNYPNPFNPTTTIRFSVPAQTRVSLNIYNTLGQKVRTLLNDSRDAGTFSVVWNGRDDAGRTVTSGLYFCRMIANNVSFTTKMLLVK